MKPLRLAPNPQRRFYRGGPAIAELRGLPAGDPDCPEDWVGSTTAVSGAELAGLSRLEDGRLLRDAIAAQPEAFLGPHHLARRGPDPGLLVKLLDAGQRLPVHCHPDRAFAGRWLGAPHGKTEAWVVVATRGETPAVHLGFREEVAPETLAGWVAGQDAGALLGSLNRLPVAAGDAIFVPAGLPHAIGAGVLIVELQEPSDLSVILEWAGFAVDGARDGHLGLGFPVALDCVDRSGWSRDRLAGLRGGSPAPPHRPGVSRLLPPAAAGFFAAERLRPRPRVELEARFSIVVVTGGEGWLATAAGSFSLARGDTLLLPFAAGEATLSGGLEAIRCLGPEVG